MHPVVLFMRALSVLPLPLIRALGQLLGYVLYAVVRPRRSIVLTNLR
jgi:lauroyl/myristoyl acyltransferase